MRRPRSYFPADPSRPALVFFDRVLARPLRSDLGGESRSEDLDPLAVLIAAGEERIAPGDARAEFALKDAAGHFVGLQSAKALAKAFCIWSTTGFPLMALAAVSSELRASFAVFLISGSAEFTADTTLKKLSAPHESAGIGARRGSSEVYERMKPNKRQIVDAVAAFPCLAMFPSAPAAHEAVMRLLVRTINNVAELSCENTLG